MVTMDRTAKMQQKFQQVIVVYSQFWKDYKLEDLSHKIWAII